MRWMGHMNVNLDKDMEIIRRLPGGDFGSRWIHGPQNAYTYRPDYEHIRTIIEVSIVSRLVLHTTEFLTGPFRHLPLSIRSPPGFPTRI